MTSLAHLPLHREISALALFITLPQLITTPIIVGISHLIHPYNVFFDIKDILEFLVISFPLTLSIAILFVVTLKGKFNMFSLVFTIAGAALLSNLLHLVIQEIPWVDLKKVSTESLNNNENRGGNSSAITWITNLFHVYWETFGPILFIQSCCIGIYAGYRYLALEESKNAKK